MLLLPKIGGGTFWHHDELLTANRSREMLLRGDPFAVTLNFAPSVKKPPLQFWVCALLLKTLPSHPEFAVRLPTLLAGAASLLAAAWLAQVYGGQEKRTLAAGSVLALAGCGYLIHCSRIALLDGGAALLLTLALAGCRLARRDALWWWFVALWCGLGAWQKAPYCLAAWALLLTTERLAPGPPPTDTVPRRPHHLPAAFAVATLGALSWWALEWLRQDHALLLMAALEQGGTFLRAHDPADEGFRPWLYWGWLSRDWVLPGLGAPVAAVAALLAWRRDRAMGELGLVCVVFGGMIACLVYRSERYLVVITPALAVVTVQWLQTAAARLPPGLRGWLLPAVLASTLPVAAFQYLKPCPTRPDLLAAARDLGRTLRPSERILVCSDAENGFDTDLFVLFYADLRRPLESLPLAAIEDLPADASPCRGICSRVQWENLAKARPALRLVSAPGNWVLWAN